MTRASFGKRVRAVAVAVPVGLAACGEGAVNKGVTPPLSSVPDRVIVTPSSVSLGFGVPYQFHAVVEDSAGAPTLDQAVRWSLSPSSPSILITGSGVVTGTCYPGGTAAVVARSMGDTSIYGTAHVFVVSTWPGVSIASIVDAGTGQPARLDSVTDSVRVVARVATPIPPCLSPQELDLVVHGAAGDTTVDRVALDTTSLPSGPDTLTFHSDARSGGVAQFPNGQYAMRVNLIFGGGPQPVPSSTINFTIKNP